MAKFTFRLATLLKLREEIRDERRSALAEAFHAEELLVGRIGEIEGENNTLRERRGTIAASGNVAVDELLEMQRYEAILTAELNTLGRQRKLLDVEITRRQEAAAEADRDVRVLEKLRERQHDSYAAKEEAKVRKELDEFANLRHGRKDRSSCHG